MVGSLKKVEILFKNSPSAGLFTRKFYIFSLHPYIWERGESILTDSKFSLALLLGAVKSFKSA